MCMMDMYRVKVGTRKQSWKYGAVDAVTYIFLVGKLWSMDIAIKATITCTWLDRFISIIIEYKFNDFLEYWSKK